ncbi:MAG: ribosome small subunit-dependent GTPase A [Treponemataceae bacterium]|nr:ribosome small subunit-dependent GTPase A [Spirochaetales bacterium]MDY6032000.1 ribosome small subunit-dependent GTPase A [Treponemataceae bacterium]
MNGTVVAGTNNIFTVECEDGIVRQCSIKGKKLSTEVDYYNPLAPGDNVVVEGDENTQTEGQITSLIKRKNEFVRWNVKGRKPQLLAANLDYIIIVTTPDEPPFRPRFVDRALAQADAQGIEPVILCNKCDLPASREASFENRLADWERMGYKIMRISAKSGEGLQELAEFLEDKLCAFVGQSGVGKSSLVNVLDSTCVLKTGSLSKKYGRGNHTTTKGTLFHLTLNESLMGGRSGAVANIIDTPGVRRFVLHEIDSSDLALYFRDFKPFLGKCTYGMSCTHTHENGCAVLAALDEGKISEERYESWQRICDEIDGGTWAD